MKTFISFITLLFSANAYSNVSYKMYSPKTKKYQEISFVKQGKFLISKDCMKGKKVECEAWKATQKQAKAIDRKDIGVLGNPAAQYCHAHKAENRILIGPKRTEYDFCLFKDGSLIESWSLYSAHH